VVVRLGVCPTKETRAQGGAGLRAEEGAPLIVKIARLRAQGLEQGWLVPPTGVLDVEVDVEGPGGRPSRQEDQSVHRARF